jgi:oligopeptidase B
MKLRASLILTAFMCAAASLFAEFDLTSTQAPVAARRPKDVTVHEDRRVDDYFWFREKLNPEVRAYLEKENAYTEAVLAPEKPLQAALFQEMRGRIKEDDTSAKTPWLGYLYYTRTEKDKQYAIYCRMADAPGAKEEVLIDLNALGQGKPYIAIGHYRVSDDGVRLAYSIDWTGYRQYEVFVMDLAYRQLVSQQIGKVSDLEWGAGHDMLYYITENDAKRSDQLHRWTLGTGRHESLYTEPDELYNLSVVRSRDSRYLFCEAQSKLTTEVRALRADDPAGSFRVLVPREENHEYHADYRDGLFYFVTNKGAKNSRIVTAPESSPAQWTELIAHRPAVKVESVDLFATHMVIHEREHGLPQFEVYDFATQQSKRLAMPDEVYEASADQNWNYRAVEYRYRYQSLARPASVFASNFTTGERRLIKETEVLGGFKSDNYVAQRVWAPARDGTQIPLSIVYRKDLDRTKPQALFLYGYGSYGISMPASFSSSRISLLDRGFIYVLAHVRGGGELGEEWRDAGRMEKKMTTFTDFVDCGQWLVDHGWTTSQQMVTSGGSAGGLLMGAVINLRPDLFKAVLAYVPFVDVLNTMLDASLPLTTEEYVEWGNPNLQDQYSWIRAYSPYDNLKAAAYPNLLVNVSFFDSQVPYWEGAKFLAKARMLNTSGNALLLHTNFGAGHGGAAGRYDALRDLARDYSFFLTSLGLTK